MHIEKDYIRSKIRTIPDWPEKGVMFRDITPIFQDPRALRGTMDAFIHRYLDKDINVIAGIDARGFLIGVTVAKELNISFVPIRKKGKLPYKTIAEEYELEYGKAAIELHEDALKDGDRVVIFDDLVATGGTMLAGINLVRRLGGVVVESACIVDLPDLKGSDRIRGVDVDVFSICEFGGL